jgi:hypothetical protein
MNLNPLRHSGVAANTNATPISAAPISAGAKMVLTVSPLNALGVVAVTVSANVLICSTLPSVPLTWMQ